jgi:hypothetical protein
VIRVHHYPPGTSKWNKIEHRLFCHITQNWRGRPLTDRLAVVELIGATTTKTGLKVESALDTRSYQKGIKIRKAEMNPSRLPTYSGNELRGSQRCTWIAPSCRYRGAKRAGQIGQRLQSHGEVSYTRHCFVVGPSTMFGTSGSSVTVSTIDAMCCRIILARACAAAAVVPSLRSSEMSRPATRGSTAMKGRSPSTSTTKIHSATWVVIAASGLLEIPPQDAPGSPHSAIVEFG